MINDDDNYIVIAKVEQIPIGGQYFVGSSLLNTTSKLINFNLPITIDPLTVDERFTAFWTTYGSALSLIVGGFAAGFASIAIEKLRKKPS